MLCAAAMIASQVGGKATRDALFLSSYDVTALPKMLIASAVISTIAILSASRAMVSIGPARLVPAAFAGSGVLLFGEWWLALRDPRIAAIVFYLHMAVFGAILISGFWSTVNERFDPRTAKRRVGQFGAGGALGGIVGGLLAERVGASLSVPVMLPFLGLLQLFCAAALAWGASRGVSARPRRAPDSERAERAGPPQGGWGSQSELRMLRRIPYLRDLATLVLLGTVCGTLLDYVFKSQAAAAYARGGDLMRFFAAFYTAVGVVTFLLQAGASKAALERLGIARTAATLPVAVAFGGSAALLVPGLVTAAIARGAEAILHSSLFRSSYELLFTPFPAGERRATKTIVDAGFDRLGDFIGGGVVALLILLGPSAARPAMMALAVLLAIAALVVTSRLHRGYVHTLERSLRSQAVALDLDEIADKTTRSAVMQTLVGLDRTQILRVLPAMQGSPQATAPSPPGASETLPSDPVVAGFADLRSGVAMRIRGVLVRSRPLDPRLAAYVVPLLARDDLVHDVTDSLREIAPRITGLLIDHLLDPDEDFVVRRRIPRLLAAARSRRAAEGLLDGLNDSRFEVRFRCGQALARLKHHSTPELAIDSERVIAAIRREVAVGRPVWESQHAIDVVEDRHESSPVDDFLRTRANRSLEHVCTLLTLFLPEEPVRIAFRGLQTSDAHLRGTSLEYLESVLPPAVREGLWPFLDDHRPRERAARPRSEILDELLRSNASIRINLEEIQRRLKEE